MKVIIARFEANPFQINPISRAASAKPFGSPILVRIPERGVEPTAVSIMSNLYRIHILEDELRELVSRVKKIKDTVIVSIDGFVVAAFSEEDLTGHEANSPQIAAMTAALVGLSEQTLLRLSQGHISRLMIEGEEGAIVVSPINATAVLAALVEKNAKMGLVLHEITRTAANLNETLSN